MKLVGSEGTKNNIYHRPTCPYAKRIKDKNVIRVNTYERNSFTYCECWYCGGIKGEIRTSKESLDQIDPDHILQLYVENDVKLYVETGMGFWKLKRCDDEYVVFHLNYYDKNRSLEEKKKGQFHRQYEAGVTDNMVKILKYIIKHDKAKEIIKDDYRKLPQNSRKEIKYYKRAKKRAEQSESNSIWDLFDAIKK